jgi:hypothetical protein
VPILFVVMRISAPVIPNTLYVDLNFQMIFPRGALYNRQHVQDIPGARTIRYRDRVALYPSPATSRSLFVLHLVYMHHLVGSEATCHEAG